MPPGQYPGWPPAPKKSNGLKWVLGAVALIAVIAVAVAVTLAVTRNGSSGTGEHGTDSASEIASADDTGPVSVITDEPTCNKFGPINDGMADLQHNGWDTRDPAVPATEWTGEQRAQYQAVASSMRNAADQFVALAKQTPHRVVRELYEQFIAYARAYSDAISSYIAKDNQLSLVAVAASSTLYDICQAILRGSASTRGPSLAAAAAPSRPAAPSDLADPDQFIIGTDPVCGDLIHATDQYAANIAAWEGVDSGISALQWTPEQKLVYDAASKQMSIYADNLAQFSRRSDNPTIQDFLTLSAQYLRAYVQSIPTYVVADSYLAATAHAAKSIVVSACQTGGG